MPKAWCSLEEVPHCFVEVIRLSSMSYGLKNQLFESTMIEITRPVAAIKSLRFAFFKSNYLKCDWHELHPRYNSNNINLSSEWKLTISEFIFVSVSCVLPVSNSNLHQFDGIYTKQSIRNTPFISFHHDSSMPWWRSWSGINHEKITKHIWPKIQ